MSAGEIDFWAKHIYYHLFSLQSADSLKIRIFYNYPYLTTVFQETTSGDWWLIKSKTMFIWLIF